MSKPKYEVKNTAGRRLIDWTEIMAAYLADKSVEMKDLSARFGVSLVSIKRHATDEGWTAARERIIKESNAALEKKLIAERLLNVDEYNMGDIKLASALRAEIARELYRLKAEGKLDSKRILDLTAAQKNNQHSARLALGLSTNANELYGKNGESLNAPPPMFQITYYDDANQDGGGSEG